MTTITRWDPMREWIGMTDHMNKVLGHLGQRVERGDQEASLGVWAPAVDVKETTDGLMLAVELPGIDPKDVEVAVENNRLSIKGERIFEQAQEDESYHRVERAYGTFERSFNLPTAYAADQIEARAKNGVLTLTIPKREEAKPKSIKVKIESK